MPRKTEKRKDKPVVLAITGASGAPYAVRLLEVLTGLSVPVELITSQMGRDMLRRESGIPASGSLTDHLAGRGLDVSRLRLWAVDDLAAPPASGSFPAAGMVICPCSVKTLSAVAVGSCRTLIERAAEVMLKEQRKLVLVLRESPYSLTQIENMRSATLAGAVILPASPAFYHKPSGISELVDFIVARVLDQLGIEHDLVARWGC
ncbi:MAG TPA: flavin prenyltransferase UbiX [Candidatus Glassbacteria bacterium]|nr:flavin prenyltransferase UbiX [Candidatus Glassbacteria bacterium]